MKLKKNPNLRNGFSADRKPLESASRTPEERLSKRIGSNTDQQRRRTNSFYHGAVQNQEGKRSSKKNNETPAVRKEAKFPQIHYLSQSEYSQGSEATVNAIVAIDTNGRIVFLNKGAEEIFQYSKAELLGRSVEILMPVRSRQSFIEQRLKDPADSCWPFTQAPKDFYVRRKNATEFLASATSDLIETERGSLLLTTIHDLTQQSQQQDQLLQAQKMEALGRLAAGIAHDFNNLLSVILGYTELELRNLNNGDAIRKSLEEIQKAGTAGASLTHELLLFARKGNRDPKIINLNELLTDMEGAVSKLLNDDIELIMRMDPDLGTVKVDETHIKQVILNLAANARDAMPHGGKLVAETANVDLHGARNASLLNLPSNRYVMLKIEDTGHGIEESTRPYLFEPFFTTKKRGVGLGLAMVHGIIKQSGGDIVVNSAPRKGTTFTIFLPRVDAATLKRRFPGVRPNPVGTNKTILIVEDRDSLRKLVCVYLKGLGYKVLEARDGVRAIRKVKRYPGPIDLLLTDVVMPVISGPELAARVKARFPGTKVVFMSGGPLGEIQQKGPSNKDIKVLRKPFPLARLAQNVSDALKG